MLHTRIDQPLSIRSKQMERRNRNRLPSFRTLFYPHCYDNYETDRMTKYPNEDSDPCLSLSFAITNLCP